MKTKDEITPRAFERYSTEEVELILSLIPTRRNVKNLATALGRSEDAIETVFEIAYSGKWLKKELEEAGPNQDDVMTKVGGVKKNLGIFVGHRPK